jgi:hypothetical protein
MLLDNGWRQTSHSAFEEEEHWIFPSMALKSNPGKRLNLRHGLSSIIRAPITYKTTPIGSGSTCFNGNFTLTSLRDGAITFLMNNDDLQGPCMLLIDLAMIIQIFAQSLNTTGYHIPSNAKQVVL